ncbi:hypothetical protein M378DRAFT_157520 [Amanita muscaria Koide BX008]|uniref:Uncharacterized protein n=1 Tax=Amanita muscaria (strain Koide BX008) TaxID=946122 RepID=A0A0C2XJK4_AMAMK|nr:hypothetical protein M378DRAFT_157520 [Amanita muscaria Koide BX008]
MTVSVSLDPFKSEWLRKGKGTESCCYELSLRIFPHDWCRLTLGANLTNPLSYAVSELPGLI